MQIRLINMMVMTGLFCILLFSFSSQMGTNSENGEESAGLVIDQSPLAADAGKILMIHLVDNDSVSVENAIVRINNGSHYFEEISDVNGNVTFNDMSTNYWEISVYYQMGSTGYEHRIAYEPFYTYVGSLKYLTMVCELTTITFTVIDNQISDPTIWGLINANITLVNSTTGANLTSFYSSINGIVQIRMPTSVFGLTVQYQAKHRVFYILNTSTPDLRTYHTFQMFDRFPYRIYVTVSETSTSLNATSAVYRYPAWTHTTALNQPGAAIAQYFEDAVSIKFRWWNNYFNVGMTQPSSGIWNTWSITRNSVVVNSSTSYPNVITAVPGEQGNFTFVFDTTNYYAGTYIYNLKLSKEGYQDAYYAFTFTIWNHTTRLDLLNDTNYDNQIDFSWNTTLNVQFNFTGLSPYVQNISNADLYYRIAGYDFSGMLNKPVGGSGVYTLSRLLGLNVSETPYEFIVSGNQTNFAFDSTTVWITIIPTQTDMVVSIEPTIRVSSTIIKVAHGENITFQVNYTDPEYKGVTDATLSITVDSVPLSASYIQMLTPGYWNISFASNLLVTTQTHTISIGVSKPNFESQNVNVLTQVLDFWNSAIEMVQPPSVYDWGEIVTFQLRYKCAENPAPVVRTNLPLVGATISELNISVKVGIVEYLQLSLHESQRGTIWNWEDLSAQGGAKVGVYSIWLDTAYLNLTTAQSFYLSPKMQMGVYREATRNDFYFQLSKVNSLMTCIDASVPTALLSSFSLNKDLGQSMNIVSRVNISDNGNPKDKVPINTGIVKYEVQNKTFEIIQNATPAVFDAQGRYLFTLNSADFAYGSYRVVVNMTAENYTYCEFIFEFIVLTTVDFNFTIPALYKTGALSLKAALGENFSFYVNLTVAANDTSLAVFLGSDTTPVDWVYPIGDNQSFFLTALTNDISSQPGSVIFRIKAFKADFIYLEKNITLEIISEWNTAAAMESPPSKNYWGGNVSFVIRYYSIEDPRATDFLLNNAAIAQLVAYNSSESIYIFSESERGTLWGWETLNTTGGYGPGFYRVWFIASIFPVTNDSVIYAIPLVKSNIYRDAFVRCPTTISPVNTELVYNATATQKAGEFGYNFQLMTLFTGENTTVYLNYSIAQDGFVNGALTNGDTLQFANVTFVVSNVSTKEVVWTNQMVFNATMGVYEWFIADTNLSPHEFSVVIQVSYLNYTSQTRTFSLIVGQATTLLNHTVNPRLRGDPNTQDVIRVAYGENFSMVVEVLDADDIYAWVEVYIGAYEIPSSYIYRNGTTRFFNVEFPLNTSIPTGELQVTLSGNYLGRVPGNRTLLAEIMNSWPTQLHVVEPPMRYPWGNIISFNTSYFCTMYPRQNELLSGAEVIQLDIILILKDSQQTILTLTPATRSIIWGYKELTDAPEKGPGYYEIWFDTSLLNLTTQEAYYILPTIAKQYYTTTAANPKPNSYVYPLPSTLQYSQKSTILDLDLLNMQVYLDDKLEVRFNYFAVDIDSIKHLSGIAGTLTYAIYDRETNSLFLNGTIDAADLAGIFDWMVPTFEIGNYSVIITASKANHVTSIVQFNLLVQKYNIEMAITTPTANNIIASPKNEELKVYFNATDFRTNSPLIGENVSVLFNDEIYPCYEDPANPGQYYFVLGKAEFQSLKTGELYEATIIFQKTNYTDGTSTVFVKVGLPVDPVLGIPYAYWIAGSIGAVVFIAAVMVRKAYVEATTPLELKRIVRAKKIISKGRSAPRGLLLPTANQEMYRKFKNNWTLLDLKMTDAVPLDLQAGEDAELANFVQGSDVVQERLEYDVIEEKMREAREKKGKEKGYVSLDGRKSKGKGSKGGDDDLDDFLAISDEDNSESK